MKELPPIPDTFTTPIAIREFEISHKNGVEDLLLEIGVPIQDVAVIGGFDWRAPVKITCGNEVFIDRACGVDSFQALELVINKVVSVKIKAFLKEKEATLLFGGEPYDINELLTPLLLSKLSLAPQRMKSE